MAIRMVQVSLLDALKGIKIWHPCNQIKILVLKLQVQFEKIVSVVIDYEEEKC